MKYLMHEEEKAHLIKPEHRRKYKTLCRQMNQLLADIRDYQPEANLYIEGSDNWNLMVGNTHDDDRQGYPLHENVALCCTVFPSSGGGW